MMVNIIIYILIGLSAGVLSGLLGIGGGLIIVPALIYICGFDQLKAQGTSLTILLPPVGIAAFLEYYKHGNTDLKAGIIIAIMLVIGSIFGAKFACYIPAAYLRKFFGFFMLILSVKMLLGK
ncbi:MAG: sulfite exporter TauE/SafE family protein [Thermoanaerobacteraceae bacterium]|nr:sulfite exporter TauE/SafE family protein [Thermoanaerobacteraceae bacterium]